MSDDYAFDAIERYMRLAFSRPGLFSQSSSLPLVLDEAEMRRFSEEAGRKVGVVYESPWNLMVVDVVEDPLTGRRFAYERVLPASSGIPVVVIPRIEGRYVLLRQFRHALRREQFAFPRGYGQDGISGEDNACKELFEELTARAISAVYQGEVCADSGLSGSGASVYLCEVDSYSPSKSEGIASAIEFTEAEFQAAIAAGEIDDGFTLSAWALLQAKERV